MLLFAALCTTAYAQNSHLNPTVQVTNTYEGKLKEVDKAVEKVFIPDSLYKFDLNFDYVGFENPYKGNDEFNPYLTDLEMAQRTFDGKRLYLKAGAGYTCAPVLDFAYTLKDKGVFKFGTHASGNGYVGNHRLIVGDNGLLLPQEGQKWFGYNALAKAGLDGRADWNDASMQMMLDYEGAFGSSAPSGFDARRAYNGLKAQMGFDTHHDVESGWRFSADLSYAFGKEKSVVGLEKESLYEHNAMLRFMGTYRLRSGSAIEVEAIGKMTYNFPLQKLDDYVSYDVILNPRYVFGDERLHLGVGLGVLVDGGKNINKFKLPVGFWPTLSLQWSAIRNKMDLYADAKLDGSFYGAREDALENNFYVLDTQYSNVRKYDVSAGMKGNLWESLDYDLGFGYNKTDNNPLFCVKSGNTQYSTALSIIHQNTQNMFAKAALKGRFASFHFELEGMYRYFFKQAEMLSLPSAITASANLGYRFRNRIGIAAGVEYRSGYKAGDYRTPFIVDLNAVVDYRLTNSLTLFLQGGNLLNRSLQYIPLYARKGVCVTAGVVLNM